MPVRDLVVRLLGVDETGPAVDSASSRASQFAKVSAAAFAVVGTAALGIGTALFKVGSEFDDAYDKIRTGTGKTGADLEGLKDDFRAVVATVPADFESASTAITDVASRLNLTGKPLQALSAQFLELSRVTGTDLSKNIETGTTALAGFGVSAEKQPSVLDQLFRASQQSGVAFDVLAGQLNSSGAQLRAVGFDVTESTALLATLGKAGMSASDVMPALSKAMAVAAKSGKDAKQVFSETFDAIKQAPTAASAASVAMEVFGAKAGPKFASMIREGKLSYDDMMKAVSGGSDTIMQAGADTADFAEQWQMFKNKAMLALEPIATRVFTMLGDYMAKFSAWWSANGPTIIATALAIGAALQTGFSVAADAIQAVFGFVSSNQTTFTVLAGIIMATFVPALVGMAAAAVASAASTVAAWATVNSAIVVSAVMARVNTAIMIAQWVAGAAASVAGAATMAAAWLAAVAPAAIVVAIVAGIVVAVVKYWHQIKAATTAAWNAVKTVIGVAVNAVKAVITTVFDAVKAYVTTVLGAYKAIITTAWAGIKTVITGAVDAVKAVITTAFNAVKAFITTVVGGWRAVITSGWDGIKSVVSGAVNAVKSTVTAAFSAVKTTITGAMDGIKGIIGRAWDTIVSGVSGLGGRIAGAARGVFDGIKNAFREAINFIIRGWNSLSFSIPSVSLDWNGPLPGGKVSVGGFGIGVPQIPQLAEGGIVMARPGGTLANIGEGGRNEAVIPLDDGMRSLGMGGDSDALLRELIEETRRNTAALERLPKDYQLGRRAMAGAGMRWD